MFYIEFLHLELSIWIIYIALNSILFLKFNFYLCYWYMQMQWFLYTG